MNILNTQFGHQVIPPATVIERTALSLDEALAQPFRFPRVAAKFETRVAKAIKKNVKGQNKPKLTSAPREKTGASKLEQERAWKRRQKVLAFVKKSGFTTTRNVFESMGTKDYEARSDLQALEKEGLVVSHKSGADPKQFIAVGSGLSFDDAPEVKTVYNTGLDVRRAEILRRLKTPTLRMEFLNGFEVDPKTVETDIRALITEGKVAKDKVLIRGKEYVQYRATEAAS